jgi:hypothetical protein
MSRPFSGTGSACLSTNGARLSRRLSAAHSLLHQHPARDGREQWQAVPGSTRRARLPHESDVDTHIGNDECGMMNDELKGSSCLTFITHHSAFII